MQTDIFGNSEVNNFDDKIFVKDQILLLNVAMNNILLMDNMETEQALYKDVLDKSFTEPSIFLFLLVIGKIAFLAVFYHNAEKIICFE